MKTLSSSVRLVSLLIILSLISVTDTRRYSYNRGNGYLPAVRTISLARDDGRGNQPRFTSWKNVMLHYKRLNSDDDVPNQRLRRRLVYPYSGELIRLRSIGTFYNSGFVEVFRAGKWGYICQAKWDLKDATVACKQLGFSSGAISVLSESLPEDLGYRATILMDEVQCSGNETNLLQCKSRALNQCTPPGFAGVVCNTGQDCPEDWISGFGKCYKFYDKAKSINLAASVCARDNASLVTIDSVAENHFLSGIIINSVPNIHQWYTGGRKQRRGWQWNRLHLDPVYSHKRRYSGSKTKTSPITFNRWFPGWPSYYSQFAEPLRQKHYDCLTLANEFKDPFSGTEVLDYYYWKAERCRNSGGIHFICQLRAESKDEVNSPNCYEDNGSTYRGNAAVTENGNLCLSWALSSELNDNTHPEKGLGDHNYCRNPDGDVKPWCWVSHFHKKFGFCKLSQCSEMVTTTESHTYSTTALPIVNCSAADMFYCSLGQNCIHDIHHCDNEKDCELGEDEVDCVYSLKDFHKRAHSSLRLKFSYGDYASEYYSGISDELCAKKCVKSTQFFCQSFLYDASKKECELSAYNSVHHGRIISSAVYDYYELSPQRTCSGKFQCADKKCIGLTSRCDGKYDCRDQSDEHDCSDEIQVNLVGGGNNSGNVKITYRGTTGFICDDEWSLQDAIVICRMLGYRGAERATTINYFNSRLSDVKFVLDKVKCTGNETNIRNCEKDPWNEHDCDNYEIAGVICRISTVCDEEQFKCKNDICVNPQELCNKNDDCGDNSDEQECQTFQIQLVNSTIPGEGRIEVTRNGLQGSICDDLWNDNNTAVVCQMLGFPYGGHTMLEGYFGSGDGPIWLDNVQCAGNEVSLEYCTHAGWAKHDCSHSEDVGIKCYQRTSPQPENVEHKSPFTRTDITTANPVKLQIRLIGGRDDSEGNVEVVVRGMNYRICDDFWGNKEANVICRTLGYRAGGIATKKSFFGPDHVSILFDNVECDGTETDFTQCLAVVGVNNHDCFATDLAGVKCNKVSLPVDKPDSKTEHANGSGKCGKRPYDTTDFVHSRSKYILPSSSAYQDSYETPKHSLNYHMQPNSADKIIGGYQAPYGGMPWQARVHRLLSENFGLHHCGAAVISEYWLISAAHCFIGTRKHEYLIIVGDYNQKQKDKEEQTFSVDEFILHEDYDDDKKDYDIALVKIKPGRDGHGIKFGNYVQPVCLPDPKLAVREGLQCWISGWGNLRPNLSLYPDILKAARIPLISYQQCQHLFTKRIQGYFSKRMFCAGYISGGVDSCDGDSGGPLVCNINETFTIIGVTSWGRGCAMPYLPGVYTYVPAFLPWIENKIMLHSKDSKESEMPSKS